jgi:hypothetical protein
MLTLQQIRDKSPCGDGWTKLLKSLGNPPLDTVISLGDVAKSNGAEDAYWCVRALDWKNEQVWREVIKALIPSVERVAKHSTDNRVHDCIGALKDWIDGKAADLDAAAGAARAATWTARAASAAGAAARQAAWRQAAWAAEAAWAVEGAEGAAEAAELEAQRGDLIAAFPPLILKD